MGLFLGVTEVRQNAADLEIFLPPGVDTQPVSPQTSSKSLTVVLPWFDKTQPDNFHLNAALDSITLSLCETPTMAELNLARRIALSAALKDDALPNHVRISRWWVEFLLNSENYAEQLVDIVRMDAIFYDFKNYQDDDRKYSKRRPKKRTDWPKEWQDCLPFIECPENLTIQEVELALAVFTWKEQSPCFSPWICKHAPDLLPRIHRFLLRRYCHELLKPFNRASKAAKRDRPPYRAGEFRGVHLRMISMITVGLIALFGASTLRDGFLVNSIGQAILIGCILLILTFIILPKLLYWEVFRQNHGFLASYAHARPRFCQLFRIVLFYGIAMSLITHGILFIHDNIDKIFSMLCHPAVLASIRNFPYYQDRLAGLIYWLLSMIVQGILATVLGVVLQSLWDSHSAIDAD